MRYFFFGTLLFWFLGMAHAESYPQRIADFSSLDFQGFKDVYTKIYHDTHNESREELSQRVYQHLTLIENALDPQTADTTKQLESQIDSFCNGNPPDRVLFPRVPLNEFIRISEQIQNLCAYEQELLILEQNLIRKNTFRTLFANESLHDSPFDIIQDLHTIDTIFYGEKFDEQKPPRPSFAIYQFFTTAITNPEFWQYQTQKGIEDELGNVLQQKEYARFEDSITGNIAGIMPALNLLSQQSLMTGVATNQVFESPLYKGSTGKAIGADPMVIETTPPDKSIPESESVRSFRVLHIFDGIIDRFLQENKAPEIHMPTQNRSAGKTQEILRESEQNRRLQFFQELRTTHEMSEWDIQSQHFGENGTSRNHSAFQQWNKDLESFLGSQTPPYSGARGIHAIFKNLLMSKPQK